MYVGVGGTSVFRCKQWSSSMKNCVVVTDIVKRSLESEMLHVVISYLFN